tara:strand:+ start:189 stop:449 length:261 start_codon:yes stop_codon:yes gene_type:complete
MKFVRIDWEDTIEHHTGWYEQEDIKDLDPPPLVWSFGLILKEEEESITVVADWIPKTKSFGRGTTVPRGMIKKITTLAEIDISDIS